MWQSFIVSGGTGEMTAMGARRVVPPARSSVGSRFSKRTLVVTLGNGRDAPKSEVPGMCQFLSWCRRRYRSGIAAAAALGLMSVPIFQYGDSQPVTGCLGSEPGSDVP